MNVLEITPYEPPVSGWVTRIKLLRRIIESRGGTCQVLDIGPSRRLVRSDCIPVFDGLDYVRKVARFAKAGFTIHCHINGEYFRGLLLCLAAAALARMFRTRCIVTLHAGEVQPFFKGWRKWAMTPLFQLIFRLADSAICNSDAVKRVLFGYAAPRKVHVIPAFSAQYLAYHPVDLGASLAGFFREHSPVVSTYVCFRDGFFTDTIIEGLGRLVTRWPRLGLVIVGTGPEQTAFERRLSDAGLAQHVAFAGDLAHDSFMTLLSKTTVHLRTPVTDGVSATVLEALSLRVPVVASDNGTRPAGVTTYPAADAAALARALDWVLRHRDTLAAGQPDVRVSDTAAIEVDLLLGIAPAATASQAYGITWPSSAARREKSAETR
jgi:glycosyltransferase involved in cell wall biosynthesis